jgi:hypothetical protein
VPPKEELLLLLLLLPRAGLSPDGGGGGGAAFTEKSWDRLNASHRSPRPGGAETEGREGA